jgi:hypothetical protein
LVAIVSCGFNLTTGSRVRQGGGQPPNARFVTEEKIGFVGISLYPAMAFVASAKRGEEGAGVARGMRKRVVGRLKEARAPVPARQAHARTHARTHSLILAHTRWTVQYQQYDPGGGTRR